MKEKVEKHGHTMLTTKQAAQEYGLSQSWFEKRRLDGAGPKYVRIGLRCVRYRRRDLEQFFEGCVEEVADQETWRRFRRG